MKPEKDLSELVGDKQIALGEVLKTLETHVLKTNMPKSAKRAWIMLGILMLFLPVLGIFWSLTSNETDVLELILFVSVVGLPSIGLFWIAFKNRPVLYLSSRGLKFSVGPHDEDFVAWGDIEKFGKLRPSFQTKSGRTYYMSGIHYVQTLMPLFKSIQYFYECHPYRRGITEDVIGVLAAGATTAFPQDRRKEQISAWLNRGVIMSGILGFLLLLYLFWYRVFLVSSLGFSAIVGAILLFPTIYVFRVLKLSYPIRLNSQGVHIEKVDGTKHFRFSQLHSFFPDGLGKAYMNFTDIASMENLVIDRQKGSHVAVYMLEKIMGGQRLPGGNFS